MTSLALLFAAALALLVLASAGYRLTRRMKAQHLVSDAASAAAVADTLANAQTWIDRADIEDQEPDELFHHEGATPHW